MTAAEFILARGATLAVAPVFAAVLVWLKLPVAVAAWLLPGWLVSRRLGSPAPVLTAFLGSAVVWFHLVLICDLFGLSLSAGPLLAAWLLLCLVLALAARRCRPSAAAKSGFPWPKGGEWVWVVAAGFGLLSIAIRAVIDPLSGWDNGFRWDYLARAILVRGNMHFYPPVTSSDFEVYAWCDGIPPLVPLLNFWLFMFTGSPAATVTAVRVIAEALLIGTVAFRFAREQWGPRGGWPAVGMLGTSALFLWGVAMGQETALLALTLMTLVWFLECSRRTSEHAAVVWAGVAAGTAALTREYGLAFPIFGLGVLVASRARRHWARFIVPATVIAAPWYVRNWVRTGNPLYPQPLDGLFPTNPVYLEVAHLIGKYWALGSRHIHWTETLATLLAVAGATLVAGGAGAWRARGRSLVTLGAIGLIGGLWLLSVPQTAGGIDYSLRVLMPGVALLAVLSGWLGARLARRWQILAAGAALLLSGDAARRAWLLPIAPRAPVWPWSFESWRLIRMDIRSIKRQPMWYFVIQAAGGGIIAVDSPASHAEIAVRGGRPSMLFSPVFAPCFDARLPFDSAVAELRRSDVRILLLSVRDPIIQPLFASHPFFRTLIDTCQPLTQLYGASVYDLDRLTPRAR